MIKIAGMVNDQSERVVALKKKFNLNNVDLARICGVSKQAVGGWINDGAQPSEEAGERLESAIGVRSEWLRKGRGSMLANAPTPDELRKELLRYLDSLPPESRSEAAADLLRSIAPFL